MIKQRLRDLFTVGHILGCGKVLPNTAKVKANKKFPIPTNKRELMHFLGMEAFYMNLSQSCGGC